MDKKDKLIKSLKVSLDVADREIKKLREKNLELNEVKLENKTKLKEIKLLLRFTNDQRRKLKELEKSVADQTFFRGGGR